MAVWLCVMTKLGEMVLLALLVAEDFLLVIGL
jgi:hypothetical protein